jgi:hypothetical protein
MTSTTGDDFYQVAEVGENPELLASLKRGMEQAALGELESHGSFAKYLDDESKEAS